MRWLCLAQTLPHRKREKKEAQPSQAQNSDEQQKGGAGLSSQEGTQSLVESPFLTLSRRLTEVDAKIETLQKKQKELELMQGKIIDRMVPLYVNVLLLALTLICWVGNYASGRVLQSSFDPQLSISDVKVPLFGSASNRRNFFA